MSESSGSQELISFGTLVVITLSTSLNVKSFVLYSSNWRTSWGFLLLPLTYYYWTQDIPSWTQNSNYSSFPFLLNVNMQWTHDMFWWRFKLLPLLETKQCFSPLLITLWGKSSSVTAGACLVRDLLGDDSDGNNLRFKKPPCSCQNILSMAN